MFTPLTFIRKGALSALLLISKELYLGSFVELVMNRKSLISIEMFAFKNHPTTSAIESWQSNVKFARPSFKYGQYHGMIVIFYFAFDLELPTLFRMPYKVNVD